MQRGKSDPLNPKKAKQNYAIRKDTEVGTHLPTEWMFQASVTLVLGHDQ
jgi:hypothetical protein